MSEESLLFCEISDQLKQPCQAEQASGLEEMTVRKAFDLGPEQSLSWLVPIEVLHKAETSLPDVESVWVDRRENTEQVLHVYVL